MAAVKTLSPFVNRSSRYFWRIRMIDNAKYGTRTISSIKYKSASDTVQLRPTLTSSMLVPVEDDNKSREHIQAQKKIWEEATRFEEDQADKFIPVTRQVLVKTLSKERSLLSVDEREKIERFSAALDSYISQQFYTQLDKMKILYDSLDPDKDTLQTEKLSNKKLLDDEYWLLQLLEVLLYKANFFKIPRTRMLRVLQEHDTSEGVRISINPKDYDTLRIWIRGRKSVPLSIFQKMKFGIKKALIIRNSDANPELEYNVFTRVFVAVRSFKEKKLHFKMFKDVPCNSLEYLLPDGKIKMSHFDKGFLTSSVFLGTVVIAAKTLAVASNFKLDLAWLGLGLAGLIGAKGWIGYKNKRNQYLVNISRTLYFKTVSNNRGVLTLLTDRAQDEEFKESLLAYVFLLSPLNRRGVPGISYTAQDPLYDTPASLQDRIEKWLKDKYKINNVQFDIDDALLKLDNLGLLIRHADGTLTTYPIDVALSTLPQSSSGWSTHGALRESQLEEFITKDQLDNTLEHHQGWQ